jgi:hypothetical protein
MLEAHICHSEAQRSRAEESQDSSDGLDSSLRSE